MNPGPGIMLQIVSSIHDSDVLYNAEWTKTWPSQFEHVFKLNSNGRTYARPVLESNAKQKWHLTSRRAVKLDSHSTT